MKCTGCDRRTNYNSTGQDELEAAGWFIWHRNADIRYHGVLLCPKCRRRGENSDAFGRLMPTIELEAAASRPAEPVPPEPIDGQPPARVHPAELIEREIKKGGGR